MSSPSPTMEKLNAYLRSLPAATRAFLISGIEKSMNAGQPLPGTDLILDALKAIEAEAFLSPDSIAQAKAALFAPLDPFVANATPEKKVSALIHRESLDLAWTWFERDIASNEIIAFRKQLGAALAANDAEAAKLAASQCQGLLAKLVDQQMVACAKDDLRRRVVVQVGGERAFEDIRDIAGVFRSREPLAAIAKRLPDRIKNLADDALETIFALYNQPAVRKPDIFPYAMGLLMHRLAQPAQVARLALKAADSDSPAKLAESPFGLGIEMLLARLDALRENVKVELRLDNYESAAPFIKDIHDMLRVLRSEIDLSGDGAWVRRISHIRTELAAAVKPTLDSMPGHIRRMLRIANANDSGHAAIDADEVVMIENQLEFLVVCRNYAGELSMNEVTRRVMGEVQSYLESQPTALIEKLRVSEGPMINTVVKQIETSVRFCAKLFGASYAQLLQKSADVVINAERKTAKGA